jgi:hypothetical protein
VRSSEEFVLLQRFDAFRRDLFQNFFLTLEVQPEFCFSETLAAVFGRFGGGRAF